MALPCTRLGCLHRSCKARPDQSFTPVLRPLAVAHQHKLSAQRGGFRLIHSHKNLKSCCQARKPTCRAAFASSAPARQAPSKAILYRQLAEAASAGNHEAAEQCFVAIEEAGYELTAYTYHGLIFSYAKADVTEAAVRTFYQCLENGLQPLPQTYATVIHSCLQNYETAIVEEIYDNLLSASVDRRPGWETYLRGLASLGARTSYQEPEVQTKSDEEAEPVWDTESKAKQGDPEDAVAAQSRDEDDDDLEDEDSEEEDEDVADLPRSGADMQEPAADSLEDELIDAELPQTPQDPEEGQELEDADSLATPVEAEAEGDENAMPAEMLDEYECILVHDQPLDSQELGTLDILNNIEARAQAEYDAKEESSGQQEGTKLIQIIEAEPLEHLRDAFPQGKDSENPVDEEERIAIQERFAEAEHELAPPPKPAVAYHPGQPNGKLQLLAKITETMEYGRQEGWYIDLDTYEDVLKLLSEDPEHAVLAQEILHTDLLERPDVQPEIRHFNCILRAEAIYRGVRHAKMTIDDMIEGKYGLDILPDIESMNAQLEGCVIERLAGKAYAIEDFQEVIASIITAGMKMNKRTHALQLMVYLQEADLDKVLWEMGEMESLAAPRRALEELSDYWLNELIVFLMDNKCLIEVLRLMTVMRDDERSLPPALKQPNENGRMFYTEWLPLFFQSSHANRLSAGLEKYRSSKDLIDYEGVTLDGNTLETVNPATGQALRVYDMDEWQVRAELEVRDIPTTGNADDRAFRLQRARNAEPTNITDFNEALRNELSAKQIKKAQREAEKDSSKNFWVILRSVEMVNHKQAKNLYTTSFREEAKGREDRVDRAFLEELDAPDLSPEIIALLKQYREASNARDLERQYMLETRIFDTEQPGFMAVNPHFHGRQGYGFKRTWPDFGRGTRLALYLMDLASLMDGAPGFMDYIRLLEGFIIEKDAEGCFELLLRLHPQAGALQEEEARLFYSKALTLCLECREVQYVSDIGLLMEELGLQPVGALDYPGVLPVLREAAAYVQTMPDYEREVGRDLGEALGGAETYRMADLEGKGEDYPAGQGEIYRQPRQISSVLNRVETLPEGDSSFQEEEDSSSDDSSEEDDWQPSDNGAGRGPNLLADPDLEDIDGEDPDFDPDWDIDN